jgi:hypothetical protein
MLAAVRGSLTAAQCEKARICAPIGGHANDSSTPSLDDLAGDRREQLGRRGVDGDAVAHDLLREDGIGDAFEGNDDSR